MRTETFKIKSVPTRVIRHGDGSQKIICLHGWGGSAESWNELAPLIAHRSNAEVVAVDLPGFGEAGMPPSDGWDTVQYAKWLDALLKKLKSDTPILVGHSFGCRVITRWLLANPENPTPVVLIGGAGVKWPPTRRQKIAGVIRPIGKLIPAPLRKLLLRKILKAHDWASCPQSLKNTLRITLDEPDVRTELHKIKNKTLLIWGSQDGMTPLRSGEVFEQKMPNATLQVIPDGRHGIHRTHAGACAGEIAKFLEK